MKDTKAIRAACKAKRSQLDSASIAAISLDISAHLWRLPALARCRRIACYFPVNGEVDCQFAAEIAWERNKEVFLPIVRGPELVFAPYRPDSKFLRNRYGIPEPSCQKREIRQGREIDVILTPLVAFDVSGNRLGMGAGFYDRSFRFLLSRKNWLRPSLIGLAYEFQKVPKLKGYRWDVPLRFAVTEKRCYTFG